MKRREFSIISRMMTIVLFTIVVSSCSSDAPGDEKFEVVQEFLRPSGNGDTSEIKIKGNGEWVATTDCEWVTLTPASGSGTAVINVAVAPNHNGESREAVVIVTSRTKNISKEVILHQSYSDLSAPTAVIFPTAGGSKSVAVDEQLTGCEAMCQIAGVYVDSLNMSDIRHSTDWISVSQTQSDLNITTEALNQNDVDVRSAILTLQKGEIRKKIHIVMADFAESDTEYAYLNHVGYEHQLAKSYVTDIVLGLSSWYADTSIPWDRNTYQDPVSNELHIPLYSKSNEDLVAKIKEGFYPIEYFTHFTHDVYSCGAYGVALSPLEVDGDIFDIAQWGGVRIYWRTQGNMVKEDIYGNATPYIHLHAGTGFITGGVYIEKANEKDAYIYVYGNHSSMSMPNKDMAKSAYKIRVDASLLD